MRTPWDRRTLAQMAGPHGQLLEVVLTGKEGEVALQWLDVDLEGDSTPQRGQRIALHLSQLRGLVATLERSMETATEEGLSLEPPPIPPPPVFGGPQ